VTAIIPGVIHVLQNGSRKPQIRPLHKAEPSAAGDASKIMRENKYPKRCMHSFPDFQALLKKETHELKGHRKALARSY